MTDDLRATRLRSTPGGGTIKVDQKSCTDQQCSDGGEAGVRSTTLNTIVMLQDVWSEPVQCSKDGVCIACLCQGCCEQKRRMMPDGQRVLQVLGSVEGARDGLMLRTCVQL